MTKLLLKLFVTDHERTEDPKVREKVGALSGFVGIACNSLLFAGKLLAGLLCGSVSIMADAMNNLSDAASSVVTLIGFKLAGKPADEDHPYGHARYEYLSGLAVAALIIVIGFELAKSSFDKILHPAAVEFSAPVMVILLASIAVKLWMAVFNRKLGKKISSTALLATSADSRNDVLATAAVLAAGLIEKFSGWQIDGYMGMAVALFILYSGANLAKETISPLLGENASPELRQMIVDTVKAEPKVIGYHDLMVHDYGPGQRFASMHVEMDSREDPILCHDIIDDIERACLREHNVHLVIHYDPVAVGDAEQEKLRTVAQQAMTAYDNRLTLHDFRMVRGTGHTNLVFDVALPQNLKGQEKAIKQGIDNALAALDQGIYYTVITFDPEAFN